MIKCIKEVGLSLDLFPAQVLHGVLLQTFDCSDICITVSAVAIATPEIDGFVKRE